MVERIELTPRPEQERDCLLCQDALGELLLTECPGCHTQVHLDCARELGQATCPVPGCGLEYRLPNGEPLDITVRPRPTELDDDVVVGATEGSSLGGAIACLTLLLPPLLGIGWLWWKFFWSVRMYYP